ncbi:MAG: DegT/DnrJ/EryC1/StrS family aminotransferase, partial [Verrucomicrobiia bacterium]
DEILDRLWLTNNGPLLQEFEAQLAQLTNAKHCVAVCNATLAIEICARALRLNGEVIVPAFTFAASAHALEWVGIRPVFADVNPQTHVIDPESVRLLISPRTTGIMGVHVWGTACPIDALGALASEHNLALFFDAAHAIGCGVNGQMIGTSGSAEVFSFHATKVLNSFEGGAITTNDDALAHRLRLLRNFGFAGLDRILSPGTNAKMTEISAAMGLVNLDSLPHFIARNLANYEMYRSLLGGIRGLRLYTHDAKPHNYQYVVVEIDEDTAGISRDDLYTILHAENVLARRYFYPPLHLVEPYRSQARKPAPKLPNTEQLSERVLCLPTGTAATETEVRIICDLIRFVLAEAAPIRSRFADQQQGTSRARPPSP